MVSLTEVFNYYAYFLGNHEAELLAFTKSGNLSFYVTVN